MLVQVHCKKCGEDFKLDIGDKPLSEVIESFRKETGFHCDPGNHVELSSRLNYWVFGELSEGSAPDPADQLKKLMETRKEVFSNEEFQKQILYEVTGFSMGCCICRDKKTRETVYFDFTHIGNVRYYYRI
jgi:hypothetical protein